MNMLRSGENVATEFRTIVRTSEGVYKDKGSKFLSSAHPVAKIVDVSKVIKMARKQYHNANHHCYGYMLGPGGEMSRAYDAGEPSHSAGDPILGQIRSRELTNTLVVVTRYFGGTKLGVSGLVKAYKTAAGQALDNAGTTIVQITIGVTIKYPYSFTGELMQWVDEYDIAILHQKFGEQCFLEGQLATRSEEAFLKRVKASQSTGQGVELTFNKT